jgi:hypothetical protein
MRLIVFIAGLVLWCYGVNMISAVIPPEHKEVLTYALLAMVGGDILGYIALHSNE